MPNNKIASYMNLKGTTLPSFRMGKNGVELRSKAIMNGTKKEVPGLFYKTFAEDESIQYEREEFEKNGVEYPEYDVAIPSRNIKRMYASKGIHGNIDTLTVVLQDGTKFTISQTITAESLMLPQDAQDGEVAIYTKTDNTVGMGKSGMTITENIEMNENEDEKLKIPTVAAVKAHITGVSEILNTRLSGNNVTKK